MRRCLLGCCLIVTLAACQNEQPKGQLQTIDVSSFKDSVNNNAHLQLVDVRTPAEFKTFFIDKAQNINYNASAFNQQVRALDQKRSVFVYCNNGQRSSEAAEELRNLGYQVYVLDGGMEAWENKGFVLQKPNPYALDYEGLTKEQFTQLTTHDKYVFVDYYATWCQPCKMMEPHIQKFITENAAQVELLKIDVDKNPAIAQQEGVTAMPTTVLYKDGKEKWRNVGYMDLDALSKNVKPQF